MTNKITWLFCCVGERPSAARRRGPRPRGKPPRSRALAWRASQQCHLTFFLLSLTAAFSSPSSGGLAHRGPIARCGVCGICSNKRNGMFQGKKTKRGRSSIWPTVLLLADCGGRSSKERSTRCTRARLWRSCKVRNDVR